MVWGGQILFWVGQNGLNWSNNYLNWSKMAWVGQNGLSWKKLSELINKWPELVKNGPSYHLKCPELVMKWSEFVKKMVLVRQAGSSLQNLPYLPPHHILLQPSLGFWSLLATLYKFLKKKIRHFKYKMVAMNWIRGQAQHKICVWIKCCKWWCDFM